MTSTGAPFAVELLSDETGEHASLTVSVGHDVIEPLLPFVARMRGRTFLVTGAARVARDGFCSLGSDDGGYLSDRAAAMLASGAVRALGEAVLAQMPNDTMPTCIRDQRARRVRGYIDLHISDPALTAPKVAASCGMSLRYLHLIFRDNPTTFDNKTFRRYLRDVRLERARQWLLDEGSRLRSIAWIAYKCGFASDTHFSRVFHERFGESPSQVRAISR